MQRPCGISPNRPAQSASRAQILRLRPRRQAVHRNQHLDQPFVFGLCQCQDYRATLPLLTHFAVSAIRPTGGAGDELATPSCTAIAAYETFGDSSMLTGRGRLPLCRDVAEESGRACPAPGEVFVHPGRASSLACIWVSRAEKALPRRSGRPGGFRARFDGDPPPLARRPDPGGGLPHTLRQEGGASSDGGKSGEDL